MQTALSTSNTDTAFFRKRQAMLIFPVIVLPFIFLLFWILGGGKGERYVADEAAANKPGAAGFNASVPNAKNGKINGRDVESPGYGKAAVGQVLSSFTHTSKDSISRGLKAIPVSNESAAGEHHSSMLASRVVAPAKERTLTKGQHAAPVSRVASRQSTNKGYYYNAPKSNSYYSGSDRQLESQLRTYETGRNTATPQLNTSPAPRTIIDQTPKEAPSSVRVTDNLTASRLSDAAEVESPFLTAPTGGSRAQPTRAVLSGGNYGSKKVIAWMIPVVVHEDQAIKDGQQVKLRLLKEITADGVTIPMNTILYAICQLSDDRLRLTVRSLQLDGQLIPLDLDVYDTDGSAGINVPGLSQSSQVNGQIRSSAIQGVQLPGMGGLANNVINSARMGASQSVRQSTIRLRAGYNLFLKAQ